MTQKVIGISQQLPFWGKRRLKGEVAEQEADSYRWILAGKEAGTGQDGQGELLPDLFRG